MTEVCLDLSGHHFTAACRQQQQSVEAQVVQQQQQQQAQSVARRAPPRCAVHGNETFVARGTSPEDLAALFPKRDFV